MEEDMLAVDAIEDDDGQDLDRKVRDRQKLEMSDLTSENAKLVLVMVGLPARGKSFIARKIQAYLEWRGLMVGVFNAGRYRRLNTSVDKSSKADYFDNRNKKASKERERYAMMALEAMLDWFAEGGEVGIFDATNTTRARRANIVKVCQRSGEDVGIIFIESICDDQQVIDANIRSKVTTSPDFAHLDHEAAIRDIKDRIKRYKSRYETVDEDDLSYIKLVNLQSRVFCNRLFGRIGKVLLEYLMAIHIGSRQICLVRPGEPEGSDYKRLGKTLVEFENVSRDNCLSKRGERFAKNLAKHMLGVGIKHREHREKRHQEKRRLRRRSINTKNRDKKRNGGSSSSRGASVNPRSWDGRTLKNQKIKVMTSLLPIAIETAKELGPREEYASLNPLHRGICGKASLEQVCRRFPEFYKSWEKCPMGTRWPGGESYDDVRLRLYSCLVEIEQQPTPVVVVSHIAVLQLLVAYFTGQDVSECHKIKIPMHTAIMLSPLKGGSYHSNVISFENEETSAQSTDANNKILWQFSKWLPAILALTVGCKHLLGRRET